VLTKFDLRKDLKHLYSPSAKEPQIIDVPEMKSIMIDGLGEPNSQGFQDSINILYGLSYTLKFMIRKVQSVDYPVMPLEGLWWTEAGKFDMQNMKKWKWTLMIMQPKYVTKELFGSAADELKKKKNPALLPKARLESFHEGLAVQIMHIGPYSAEGPAIEKLHKYAEEKGYEIRGKHHEIYMSDPRRTAASKLKTILRNSVEKAR
jgi:hypothetical protein